MKCLLKGAGPSSDTRFPFSVKLHYRQLTCIKPHTAYTRTQSKSSEGKHPFKGLRWKSQHFPVTAGVLLPSTGPAWLTQSTKGSRGRWGRLITHHTANSRLQARAEDSSSQPCCCVGQLDKGLGETGMPVTPLTGYLSVRVLWAHCSSVWVAASQWWTL